MGNFSNSALLVIAIAISLVMSSNIARSQEKEILIGSGGRTGVYYPVAISICRLFNREHRSEGYKCSVATTKGSIDNLKKLREGEVNFAIVQSDWQSHAFKGTGVFSTVYPNLNLRSLFALYSESFTVLARSSSNIRKFEDLNGRGVNIGNPGSGQRATMEIVMKAFEWNRFDFSYVREFDSRLQAQALCDGEVDAIVFVAGHPSGTIKSATEKCESNFVSVDGPIVDALVDDNKFYRKSTINTGLYFKEPEEISTFGVNATMVTDQDTDSNLIGLLLESVFKNLAVLKTMHPALADLNEVEMKKNIMPAPMHQIALDFYK
jgi:TRAP transporter TAXI family solute receptor